MALTFGSLFAGIGGLDLGLERAGMVCRFQVEKNDYATKILQKHWPHVPKFRDVRDCGAHNLPRVDLLCGGFPCQDISNAAAGHEAGLLGLAGERSGLWFEFERIICELLPRWVVIENSSALSVRGIGTVLRGLAESGYDADWATVSASALGALHQRQRLFIVASRPADFADPGPAWIDVLSHANGAGLQGHERSILAQPNNWRQYADTARSAWGNTAPRICGKSDGVPHRVDRLKCLGNAVVPQVAEWIGRRICEASRPD